MTRSGLSDVIRSQRFRSLLLLATNRQVALAINELRYSVTHDRWSSTSRIRVRRSFRRMGSVWPVPFVLERSVLHFAAFRS